MTPHIHQQNLQNRIVILNKKTSAKSNPLEDALPSSNSSGIKLESLIPQNIPSSILQILVGLSSDQTQNRTSIGVQIFIGKSNDKAVVDTLINIEQNINKSAENLSESLTKVNFELIKDDINLEKKIDNSCMGKNNTGITQTNDEIPQNIYGESSKNNTREEQ